MATFSYTPDFEGRKNTTPKVTIAKFGDSYEQRQADGINGLPKVWNLTFSLRENSEADAIEAFLEARAGVEAFDWTPPYEVTAVRVKCSLPWERTWTKATRSTISCVFEQVFEPSV